MGAFWGPAGAGNGTRTRDPQLGRLTLYQLSYSRNRAERHTCPPNPRKSHNLLSRRALMDWGGEDFEPPKPAAADLQSAPFDHSGTSPSHLATARYPGAPRMTSPRAAPLVPPSRRAGVRDTPIPPSRVLPREEARGGGKAKPVAHWSGCRGWSWREDLNPQPPHYK